MIRVEEGDGVRGICGVDDAIRGLEELAVRGGESRASEQGVDGRERPRARGRVHGAARGPVQRERTRRRIAPLAYERSIEGARPRELPGTLPSPRRMREKAGTFVEQRRRARLVVPLTRRIDRVERRMEREGTRRTPIPSNGRGRSCTTGEQRYLRERIEAQRVLRVGHVRDRGRVHEQLVACVAPRALEQIEGELAYVVHLGVGRRERPRPSHRERSRERLALERMNVVESRRRETEAAVRRGDHAERRRHPMDEVPPSEPLARHRSMVAGELSRRTRERTSASKASVRGGSCR